MVKNDNACVLSNIGAELLERGNFEAAHDTLHAAVAVFREAFLHSQDDAASTASSDCGSDIDELFEEAELVAGIALDDNSHKVYDSTCHVQAVIEEERDLPDSIFDVRVIVDPDTFLAHPFVVDLDSQEESSSSSSSANTHFHCATVVYNFALTKLCLHHCCKNKNSSGSSNGGDDDRVLLTAIRLLQVASNLVTQAQEEVLRPRTRDRDYCANLDTLCALVLSSLARAWSLVSDHAKETRETLERLSVLHAKLLESEDLCLSPQRRQHSVVVAPSDQLAAIDLSLWNAASQIGEAK